MDKEQVFFLNRPTRHVTVPCQTLTSAHHSAKPLHPHVAMLNHYICASECQTLTSASHSAKPLHLGYTAKPLNPRVTCQTLTSARHSAKSLLALHLRATVPNPYICASPCQTLTGLTYACHSAKPLHLRVTVSNPYICASQCQTLYLCVPSIY